MAKSCFKNKMIEINGTGAQTRDFLYAADLCRAIINCCYNKKRLSSLYQIGSGKETKIINLAKILKKYFKEKYQKDIVIKFKKSLPGDVRRNYTDTLKFRNTFNWRPSNKLRDNIFKTISWIEKN